MHDTICSIATASGNGAIGIIRISGERAFEIRDKIFFPKQKSDQVDRLLIYGMISIDGNLIDEALCASFTAPNSYTAENMIELQAHGGYFLLNSIQNHILKLGAKLATPGEFTKRAFENGKIDLTKAEAINEIVNAPDLRTAHLIFEQLNGKLRKQTGAVKTQLLAILAQLNASIDFSDEDISPDNYDKISSQLDEIIAQIDKSLATANNSILKHHGYQAVIIGAPNAGKSSLINKLTDEDQAIVSDIPGTTRDLLKGYINIDGLRVEIVDTAGIHANPDQIEAEGIKRAIKLALKTELVIVLIDLSQPIPELPAEIKNLDNSLIIGNKVDLVTNQARTQNIWGKPILSISAKTGEGIAILKQEIQQRLRANEDLGENLHVFNQRQKSLLEDCSNKLSAAKNAIAAMLTEELISTEVQSAVDALSSITGEVTSEDVLGEIFSNFCVGK